MFLKISFEDFSYGYELRIGLNKVNSTWEVVRVFPVSFLELFTNLLVFPQVYFSDFFGFWQIYFGKISTFSTQKRNFPGFEKSEKLSTLVNKNQFLRPLILML